MYTGRGILIYRPLNVEEVFLMAKKESREAGFSLLGMLIAVGIVAVLAMIAVPKFNSAVAKANTAKIQADLSTIETAMGVYTVEKGKDPGSMADLKEYIVDAENLKPPQGKCFLRDQQELVLEKDAEYTIGVPGGETGEKRALCDGHALSEFGI